MKLLRVDSDREPKEVERIEVEIGGVKYTITDRFGEMKLHAHSDEIIVKPCCANEVVCVGLDK
jgi:hypothetical protein